MLKIEVGKYYRTRGGWKAKVVADDMSGRYPLLAVQYQPEFEPTPVRMSLEGVYAFPEHSRDLIAEWVDPPKPMERWLVFSGSGLVIMAAVSLDAARWYAERSSVKDLKIVHMMEVVDE